MDQTEQQQLETFYRDTILRHSVDPVGLRKPISATHSNEQYNPLCGDRIRLDFAVSGDTIEAASFDGEACAICMASASMTCQQAEGHTVQQLRDCYQQLELAVKNDTGPIPGEDKRAGIAGDAHNSLPNTLHALLGVRRYPSRIRCALLPWEAAIRALNSIANANSIANST